MDKAEFYPEQRKVIQYVVLEGCDGMDGDGHGTHVAGTAAGAIYSGWKDPWKSQARDPLNVLYQNITNIQLTHSAPLIWDLCCTSYVYLNHVLLSTMDKNGPQVNQVARQGLKSDKSEVPVNLEVLSIRWYTRNPNLPVGVLHIFVVCL